MVTSFFLAAEIWMEHFEMKDMSLTISRVFVKTKGWVHIHNLSRGGVEKYSIRPRWGGAWRGWQNGGTHTSAPPSSQGFLLSIHSSSHQLPIGIIKKRACSLAMSDLLMTFIQKRCAKTCASNLKQREAQPGEEEALDSEEDAAVSKHQSLPAPIKELS